MKKFISSIFILSILTISLTGCDTSATVAEFDGAKVADQILSDFDSGLAISYREVYENDEYQGEYIFNRDAEGNISISNVLIDPETNEAYSYSDYKVNGTYYSLENNEPIEADDATSTTYFEEQTQYVHDMIEYYGADSFDPTIEATYSIEDDNYVVSGVYEETSDSYRIEIAKDGSLMSATDSEYDITISFDYDKTIEAPSQSNANSL